MFPQTFASFLLVVNEETPFPTPKSGRCHLILKNTFLHMDISLTGFLLQHLTSSAVLSFSHSTPVYWTPINCHGLSLTCLPDVHHWECCDLLNIHSANTQHLPWEKPVMKQKLSLDAVGVTRGPSPSLALSYISRGVSGQLTSPPWASVKLD